MESEEFQHIMANIRLVRGVILHIMDKAISFLLRITIYWIASIFAGLQLFKFAYFWVIKGRSIGEKKDRRNYQISLFKEDPPYGSHRHIEIQGHFYHYVEAGNSNGPLVLFLHGFPQCWYQWRHQLAAFSELHYHLVALDLPGFGGSNPPAKFSIGQVVTDIRNFISVLSPTHRAHAIIGHDIGGFIAYAAAMQSWKLDQLRCRRGFIDKLMISNVPHPLVMPGNMIDALLTAITNITPQNLFKSPFKTLESSLSHLWLAVAQIFRSYHLFIFQLPSPIPEFWLQAFDYDTFIGEISECAGAKFIKKMDQELYKAAMAYKDETGIKSAVKLFRLFLSEEWLLKYHTSRLIGHQMTLSQDSIWREQIGPDFGKIGYPTLILWGDQDPFLGKRVSRENSSNFLPESIEIRIPRAGHFLPEERPQLFNQYLSLFISGSEMSKRSTENSSTTFPRPGRPKKINSTEKRDNSPENETRRLNMIRLTFPSLSTDLAMFPVHEAASIACEIIREFLTRHNTSNEQQEDSDKDDPFELILYDPDHKILQAYKDQWGPDGDSRLKFAHQLFNDEMKFLPNLESRYLVNETTWRLKPYTTSFSKMIKDAIGPELASEIEKLYPHPGIQGGVYPLPVPKNSQFCQREGIENIIYVVSPNMSPIRSNPVSLGEGRKLLRNCYKGILDAFSALKRSKKSPLPFEPSGEKKEKSAFDVLMQSARNPVASPIIKSASGSPSHSKNVLSWNLVLLEYLDRPERFSKNEIFFFDKDFVVVWDKFPKAREHLLVIPRRKIDNIESLTKDDIPLVRDMQTLAKWVIERLKENHPYNLQGHQKLEFRLGFHAIPSMKQLHMHIISRDMVSTCLKKKMHYLSFTTDFFKTPEDIIEMLEKNEEIKFDKQYYENKLKGELNCHLCERKAISTMPKLREHLGEHWHVTEGE
ncbi:hypothetical protein G9A89_023578 [Geosiphon pyriformis]|nr:hypothetical protein G9A89_023578 [Geosiphon pyriformis]